MAAQPAAPAARRCPICGKPSVAAFRSFCSRRCADVDLNRWFTGAYAVPVEHDDDDQSESDEGDAE